MATYDFQKEWNNKGEVLPYTEKPFLNKGEDFHFAIIADRGGSERKGFFGATMKALNLLRPEFTICVGDLIEGCSGLFTNREESAKILKEQSDELEDFINTLDMRFFYVVGNHDIFLGWPGKTIGHETSKAEWKKRHGENTYYDFMYKNCHFVCMDSMDGRDGRVPVQGITDEQYEWALKTLEAHSDARWTFLFVHMPIDWTSDKWLAFERKINKINYTLFCGDWHNHVKAVRHGKNYYMLGTCGGGFDKGVVRDDLRYGIMDSVTWVTVTDNGPVIANLQLSGIHGDEIQRCSTTKGWIETPLDYPDHKSINDNFDAEGTGDGSYDWHFRHAMILRNDAIVVKPEVVIAGDGIIHRWGGFWWFGDKLYPRPEELDTEFFNNYRVLNMGFAGDKNENLLWRIRHGELEETDPKYVILHIGSENLKAGGSAEKTLQGIIRNVKALKMAAPRAEIKVLAPLEDVPYRKELNSLLRQTLAEEKNTEFLDLKESYEKGGTASLEEYFLADIKKNPLFSR